MRLRYLLGAVLAVVLAVGGYYVWTTPRYSQTVHHQGDLYITDVMEITDTKYVIDGNLIIKGEGKLIVKDSMLEFPQESNSQYRIEVGEWGSTDSPELYLENVVINTNNKWMYATYAGTTRVTIIDCDNGNIPWHSSGSNVDITLKNTDIGFTIADNVSLKAENCRLFLEFVLRECNGTYTLPMGAVNELNYSFKMGDETLKIETTDCYFRDWGVSLDYNTDITYVDTEITIGMNAGTNPDEKAKLIELTGLRAQRYDDFSVDYDTNHVHLVNTKVTSWYPQAFNGVTVDISDSDLADVQWNSNNSTVIVRNSKVAIDVAKENVTYRFINCVINGDVTAKENSTIYLEDTTVKGKITTYDNGGVIIDGEPYTG